VKILGWTADDSACGHYRMIWPFEALAAAGVDAAARQGLTGNEMLEADLTIVQRTCLEEPVRLLELVKGLGGRFVFEADDDLFNVDPANPVAHHFASPAIRAGLHYAIDMSVAVTVSTEPLAEAMREHHDHVLVLPNFMPDHMAELSRPEPDGTVRVVWAGSATHHGDFHKDVRYGVTRALPGGAGLSIVGFDYRKKLGSPAAEYVPWSESIPAFHRSLVRYDVGLCPLARTRFNRSKSGIKAMEYQAAGVVPIAQDCESYRDVVEDGVDGFLVRTQWEWKDRIELLTHDHELREQMSLAGMARTAERTYGANAWRWAEAYAELSLVRN
jgi:hypothetical protein